MWNKIGSWLDYPDTWCEFALKVLGKVAILFGLFLWATLLLLAPLLMFTDFTFKGNDAEFANNMFVVVSLVCWWVTHLFLNTETEWYPDMLDKLPKCPKINWNKNKENRID
jgi:hypothetical protein